MQNSPSTYSCKVDLQQYKKKNKKFFENNIISSFLDDKSHQELLMKTLSNPSTENNEELDQAFKRFYFNIRFTSYISSALYFNAINFDKKHRKISNRFPLTVDSNVGGEEGQTFKDIIADRNAEIRVDQLIKRNSIMEYLEDRILYEAVQRLTDKQREILYFAYVKGMSDTEIGILLGKSQQVVSKHHKKALKSIYTYFTKKEEIKN